MAGYFVNTVTAGTTWEIYEAGKYFRILSATGAVRVEFFANGSSLARVDNVQGGLWRESPDVFDKVRITDQSGAANAVEVMIDSGRLGYDRLSISGAVTSQAKNATPTQSAATVTTTSATLLPASTSRRYLLIQNKDGAGTVYINLAGAAATVANGVKLGPGQSYESGASWVTAAAITAIGDIASNANIVVVEGA